MAETEGDNMKRNYVETPVYEMMFEMTDGEVYYLYGNFEPKIQGKIMLVGDCIPLYSRKECDRIGLDYNKVPWIDMPYGDYTCEYYSGLVAIKKDDKIVLMFYRNHLKRCVTQLPKRIDIAEQK